MLQQASEWPPVAFIVDMLGAEVLNWLRSCVLALLLGIWVLNGLQQDCREGVRLWAARVELGVGGMGEEEENGDEPAGRWGRRELRALEAARNCGFAGAMTIDTTDSDD